jgi:hypothetical protein
MRTNVVTTGNLLRKCSMTFKVMSLLGVIVIGLAATASGARPSLLERTTYVDRYGYIDLSGRMVVPLRYDDAQDFSEGLAAVCDKHGKWNYIDNSGKVVIKTNFSRVGKFSEGLAAVMNDSLKYGFIDKHGHMVIDPQFDEAYEFSEALAAVKINNHWGFINRTGDIVIAAKYDGVQNFAEGLASVSNSFDAAWVDHQGDEVIRIPQGSASFTCSYTFSEGRGAFGVYTKETNGRFGYVNKAGDIVIKPTFLHSLYFHEGLSTANTDDGWGYIDQNGKIVIPAKFCSADDFHEGLAAVTIAYNPKSLGYIDRSGTVVISEDVSWEMSKDFSLGRAAVRVCDPKTYDHKWGYIDRQGKFAIKPTFNKASDFREGLARVSIQKEIPR